MRVGRWELSRRLGQGGMGEVWLGRDPTTGEEAAVKLLAPGALDAEHRLRFAREVEAMVRLRHPHVVRWLDSGQEGPRPWVAMEVCPGGTLAERVAKDGPLAPRAAVELIRDLAGALAAAHAAGVLHRDLKPHNVMFDADGQARLADFGLARLVTYESLTETGAVMGSPGYLAPEQVHGDKQQFGPATDVWGLGAVLYFLLTGAAPFHRTSVMSSVKATLLDPAPAPSAKRPEVDARLDALVLRCLAKSPMDRWPSALALRAALEGWLGLAPAEPRRARSLVLGLCLGAASALGSGLVLARREPRPPAIAEVGAASTRAGPAGSPATIGSTAADSRLHEARRAWLRGQPELALKLTGEVLGEGSTGRESEARLIRALVFQCEGRDQEAADELDRLRSDPHLSESRAALVLGLTSIVRGRSGEAIEPVARACDLAPLDADAALIQARAYYDLDKHRKASESAGRALALEPQFVEALVIQARLLVDTSNSHSHGPRRRAADLESSLELLDRALAIAPDHRRALFLRASLRLSLNDPAAALVDCRRAIELDGASAPTLDLRASILWELDERDAAIADLRRVVELEPRSELAHFKLGQALAVVGLLTESRRVLDRAVEEDVGSARSRYERARVRQKLGDLQGARSDFSLALEYDITNAGLGARDPATALEDLNEALVMDPQCAGALAIRGLVRTKLDALTAARADFDRALELNSQSSVTWDLRARVRQLTGDLPGALSDFDRAIAEDPRSGMSYLNRAKLREMLGDLDGAKADRKLGDQLLQDKVDQREEARSRAGYR